MSAIKIACYSCSAKIETDNKPLAIISCPKCESSITIPLTIGDYVLERKVYEDELYTSYKSYKNDASQYLSIKVLKVKLTLPDFTHVVGSLKQLNANEHYDFLYRENESLLIRDYHQTSLAKYLESKKLQAAKALETLKALASLFAKLCNSTRYIKALNLEQVFLDKEGDLLMTDLGLQMALKKDAQAANEQSTLASFKALTFHLLCRQRYEQQSSITKLNLRDSEPKALVDFLNLLLSDSAEVDSFSKIQKALASIDLSAKVEDVSPQSSRSTPEPSKAKKLNVNNKSSNAKNILKRQRQKSSALIPAIAVVVLVLAGLNWFINNRASFTPPKEVIVKKIEPKNIKKINKPTVSKIKVEPREIRQPPKFRDIRELPKLEFRADIEGAIGHSSFSEIIETKCMSCHGEPGKEIEGKFNLKKLMASTALNSRYWQAFYEQVESGEMPPEDEAQLSEDEKLTLLTELKKITAKTEITRKSRALTPAEIQNTLVDLFKIDEAVFNPFTPLQANYGKDKFYTNQKSVITPYYIDDLYEALHDTMESYVALKPQTEPLDIKTWFPGAANTHMAFEGHSDLRWYAGSSALVQMNYKITPANPVKKKRVLKRDLVGPKIDLKSILDKLTVPPGTYKISFDAQALNLKAVDEKKYGKEVADYIKKFTDKYEYSLPLQFHLVPPGQADPHARGKKLMAINIHSSEVSRYSVNITINRRNGMGFNFASSMAGDRELAPMIARHVYKRDCTEEEMELIYNQYLRIADYELPMIRFQNVTIEGPFDVQVSEYSVDSDERIDDISIRKNFRALHNDNLIQMNMPYDYIFSKFKQRQIGPEESYRNALVSFFLSPEFLTLEYDLKDKRKHPRMLSYALHKSPPTKELNEQYNKVIKSRQTSEFTEWLVDHKHFSRYIDSFSQQWLHLPAINNAMPERRNFGIFYDQQLLPAFKQEVKEFILYLFKENRPIRELVAADYSFVNNKLISFYEGGQPNNNELFDKHTFTSKNRGGILSSGAFLTATGNGLTPLPIKRAEWILKNILDSKLPPPPDDIKLDEFQQAGDVPFHKRLKQHSENPKCFSCHKKMDPIAVVMNAYNTIGGVNHKNTSSTVKLDDQVIRNFGDFKSYLATQEESIARGFVKSLLRYSLGRELFVQDAARIDQIIEENRADRFPTRNLFNSMIKTYFFKL